MAATLPCRHHQYGYCKYGLQCRKQHTDETCENFPCTAKSCSKRHPKVCKYFLFKGNCKFNENCSFLHKHVPQSAPSNHEKEIEKLREDIESLTKEINKMKEIIDSVSKPDSSSNTSKPSTDSTNSHSLSFIQKNQEDQYIGIERIPQLDGQLSAHVHHQELPAQHKSQEHLQCETCHKIFQTRYDFEKHDEMQFCCDDCEICLSLIHI